MEKQAIHISYKGHETAEDVTFLHNYLKKEIDANIDKPRQIKIEKPVLGVGEIIITIIITSLARTTLDYLVDKLEDYCLKKTDSDKNDITIVIKHGNNGSIENFPFKPGNKKSTLYIFNLIRRIISEGFSKV